MELKYPDGQYKYEEIEFALESDFKSERDLADYIELNIDLFTKECLGFEYLAHERERPLVKVRSPRQNIVLVSSKVDHITPMIITKFNLPIWYISMDKSKHLTFKVNGQNGQ